MSGTSLKKLAVVVVLVLSGTVANFAHAADPQKANAHPNIVFILADDVGWGDLGCYGSTKTRTPNLDRLATQGTRFTDAYVSAPVCTASRYALLTGRNHWRDGVNFVMAPDEPLAIHPERPNLPLTLKAAGYATGIVGKWHLGFGEKGPEWNGLLKPGPLEVGFDYYFGYPSTNDRVPCVYIENHRVVGLDPADPIRIDMNKPLDDKPTGTTPGVQLKLDAFDPSHRGVVIDGIGRMGYMAGGASAMWKTDEMAETLTAKSVQFIEQHRDGPFFLYFATNDIHAPVWPNERFRNMSQSGRRGDAIFELDWSVGEILSALDRSGLTGNTLVLFSSDNGGVIESAYRDPGSVASGHQPNAPWRGWKGQLYEGGVRMPFIARWPGHVAAGKVSDEMFCLVDTTATVAALTGQAAPQDALDSVNVLPELMGQHPEHAARRNLVCSMDGHRFSVRQGPWKLHADRPGEPESHPVELYNLQDDPSESKNLAADRPEVVQQLRSILDREIARTKP